MVITCVRVAHTAAVCRSPAALTHIPRRQLRRPFSCPGCPGAPSPSPCWRAQDCLHTVTLLATHIRRCDARALVVSEGLLRRVEVGLRQGRPTLLLRHRRRVLLTHSQRLLPLGRVLALRRARRKAAAPAAARRVLVDALEVVAWVLLGVKGAAASGEESGLEERLISEGRSPKSRRPAGVKGRWLDGIDGSEGEIANPGVPHVTFNAFWAFNVLNKF